MNHPQRTYTFRYPANERLAASITARKARIAHQCLTDAILAQGRPANAEELAALSKFRAIEARANVIQAPTLHTPA